TLAEGGLHRPVRLLEDEGTATMPLPADARLLSPGASWAVAEILTDLRRPDLPDAWDITRGAPEVAWKTGTSYGHRDAWAVGWSGRYALGGWVGTFDGTPVLGISGSQHAAPLLFDLFRAIERDGGAGAASAPRRPPGARLETIEVCAESHELPGPYCP